MDAQKSILKDFYIGERVETSPNFCNGDRRLGLGRNYHSGKVKIISPSLPSCEPGSMISFISEQNNEVQYLHETNLQLYTGERMIRDDKITSSNIEDTLKKVEDNLKE